MWTSFYYVANQPSEVTLIQNGRSSVEILEGIAVAEVETTDTQFESQQPRVIGLETEGVANGS